MDRLQYRLERQKAQQEQEKYYADLVKELAKNPIIELIGGSLFFAWAFGPKQTDSWLTQFSKGFTYSTAMGGVTAVITAQQLAPSLPYLLDKAPAVLGGLLK